MTLLGLLSLEVFGAPLWLWLAGTLGSSSVAGLVLTVWDVHAERRAHRDAYLEQLERWRA